MTHDAPTGVRGIRYGDNPRSPVPEVGEELPNVVPGTGIMGDETLVRDQCNDGEDPPGIAPLPDSEMR